MMKRHEDPGDLIMPPLVACRSLLKKRISVRSGNASGIRPPCLSVTPWNKNPYLLTQDVAAYVKEAAMEKSFHAETACENDENGVFHACRYEGLGCILSTFIEHRSEPPLVKKIDVADTHPTFYAINHVRSRSRLLHNGQ
jgi:hypothetical protein